MANTGLPWELPYQALTDPPNGPLGLQELAQKVAACLGYAYPCTTATRPAHATGRIIYDTDTDQLLISNGVDTWDALSKGYDDTGWLDPVTAGFTPIGAHTISSGSVCRRNGVVSIYVTMTTTAGFAAGDVTNTACLQAPGDWLPGGTQGGFNGGANGGGLFAYITSGGAVTVNATATAYGAGATFQVAGQYLL